VSPGFGVAASLLRAMALACAGALAIGGFSTGIAQTTTGPASPVATSLPRPFPSVEEAQRIQRTAEARPLFSSRTPLAFTLVADFKAVQRDRDPVSTVTFPATLRIAGADGNDVSIALRIRTRGHSRRKPTGCIFAPLRLEFTTNPIGTVFEGQKNLKLGTHCRDQGDYSQYVVREYPIYQMYSLLTPRSFRARLAQATYVDAKSKKPIGTRIGLFLEDDDDVARRMGGRSTDETGLTFGKVDLATTRMMTIFAYMIGNTDMSIAAQHNVRIVEMPDSTKFPVPYDFDYAGVVNARYAVPDAQLRLSTVRERLYRGPCFTAEQLEPELARFRSAKANLLQVYDDTPLIKPADRRSAKAYLEQFFRTIDRPEGVKKAFIDDCGGRGRM
jgi:hypothetical protein